MTFKRIFTYVTVATAFLVIGMSPLLMLSGMGSSASTHGSVVVVLGFLGFGGILGGVLAWAAYLDKKQGVNGGENESSEEELAAYVVTELDDGESPQRTKRLRMALIVVGIWIALFFACLAYWILS